MGDFGPWGGAGEDLLGVTLFGTACRRSNQDCLMADSGGSCPAAQRDQATSTAELSGRRQCGLGWSHGPQVHMRSGTIDHADVGLAQ